MPVNSKRLHSSFRSTLRGKKDAVSAKAREDETVIHDYGESRIVKHAMLDVTIPFSGDSNSFKLRPSQCALLSQRISLGETSLTLSVQDDQNAQREVDSVVNQLMKNLDALRAEYDQSKPQMEQAIQQAAESRKAKIVSENDRDKNLTFKVER